MATIQFYRWTMYKFTRYMLKGNLITFRVIFVAGLKEVKKKIMFANMKRRDLKSICFIQR